mmetsp:Transcript_18586/g.34419  ORF Transcript_18586/g.34419 Transcript_18586/m.34419 type:complete len:302 (-) Transcript_18586:287-1192(-)|eukprot:CAMPEP_0201635564 /NCGR_PEP_ID=MMETSP0493-20130528/8054_1 /ASSEMBLY_ACC=CAM_ASM_000838 /TAXON_ID=420259 /ORGANISM="Thalassiosira gravida, Strain GMp14c1" /LENGTH=301 /DNA_ID=CAMNT_0048107553 /DNA_START=144 /DNA_END=1049 /DNA_ORIENTATION=+
MSFQDVGRPGARPPQRRTQPSGSGGYSSAPSSGGSGGAFSSAAAGGGSGGGGRGVQQNGAASVGGGYEQVSDSIVQYQRNIALLEKLARNVGTKHDTSVSQTQYNLQLEVIQQLGQRIETQFRSHESRLSTLPRSDASSLRTTHVKLTRDYRLVEQQFKTLQLDVKRKRGLAEVRAREAEEERMGRNNRGGISGVGGVGGGGGGDVDGAMTEEGMRWQMQIQEDKINEEIMQEREEEIKNIHKGMHQVNEIYKDLAHLVDEQQEGVDQIETQMENAKENTATGLKHIEKANESSQSQCIIS